MKFFGVALGCVVFGIFALATNLLNELSIFFFIGKLPYLPITLSPIFMFTFWILIIPIAIIIKRTGIGATWTAIELIGRYHQRKLNRKARLFLPKQKPSYALFATAGIMFIIFSSPEDKSNNTKLIARRRFAALPI